MKKWMIFVAGIVVGFVLAFLIDVISNKNPSGSQIEVVEPEVEPEQESEDNEDIYYFEKPGDIIEGKSFKVFQVLEDHAALVNGESRYSDAYTGPVYLLVNDEEKYYYDDEVVKIPQGKVLRQVGIFKYLTNRDILKTVPIVKIMDK